MHIACIISKDPKYFTKKEEGIAKWNHYVKELEENINSLEDQTLKAKFLYILDHDKSNTDSKLDPLLTVRSIKSTFGVINSGYMKIIGYDGVTLTIEIIIDSEITDKLIALIGPKLVFSRIVKFLEEYYKNNLILRHNKFGFLRKNEQKLEELVYSCIKSESPILIMNSALTRDIGDGAKFKKLKDSIGLKIIIKKEPNVVSRTLFSISSKGFREHLNEINTR